MSVNTEIKSDCKVVTFSRVALWRIERIRNEFRCSGAFKIGNWNWYLSVNKRYHMLIRLYPERSHVLNDSTSMAKFVIRVSSFDRPRKTYISPIYEKLLQSMENFVWTVEKYREQCFTVMVEFLDFKASSLAGGVPCPTLPNREILQALSSKSALRCLSRMLEDGIQADVTIETSGGALKAHKAILASSSPIFERMFFHDPPEKQSSTIKMEGMSLESCSALLSCLYGTIKLEDLWKHHPALFDAAKEYDMPSVKDLCEESLLEDINLANVLERLHVAWLYQLHKLKKACFTYLFECDMIYNLREEMCKFFQQADRDLLLYMFQGALTV